MVLLPQGSDQIHILLIVYDFYVRTVVFCFERNENKAFLHFFNEENRSGSLIFDSVLIFVIIFESSLFTIRSSNNNFT